MKGHFHLGKNFYLPETIITETIAVLGIRGSGKTTTAKDIVEEALKRRRQVAIIDPTDAWWGVKSGFEIVVFGGAHGDLPLEEGSGKLIADFVVDHGVSVILSLRHLRKAAQKRLITAFNEQLYFRKGEVSKRTPVLVVIDECDAFIPQKVMGEDAKSVGAVEDLVRRGRNAGIGVVLISQRAASINKDVLTQLTVLVAHKHTSPQDRKALEEWIRGHDSEDRAKIFLESLAALPIGVAWVWAPDLDMFQKVEVRKSETFDSSATPKLGAKITKPKSLKPVDLNRLKEQMSEQIKVAEDNDPTKLKEQIRKLKAEVQKKAPTDQKSLSELVEAQKEAERRAKEFQRMQELACEALKKISTITSAYVEKISGTKIELIDPSTKTNLKFPKVTIKGNIREYRMEPMSMRDIEASRNGDEKLPSGVRKLLTVLAQDPHSRSMPASRVALRAGMSQNSTLRNYLSIARTNGWIEGKGDNLRITARGQGVLGTYELIPTDRESLLEYWKGQVSAKQAEILQVLFDQGVQTVDYISSKVGMELNSTWRNYISQLRTLGLIKGSKELYLSEDFVE